MQARNYSVIVPALGLLCTSACSTLPDDSSREETHLMEISREWSRAAASGDVDRIANYWDQGAVVMMAGLPTFRGKPAIRTYVSESMKIPGFKISWEPLEAHVSASKDMGYILERTQVTMPDSTGKLRTTYFRAVSVWRKGANRQWRNVVDISNPEAAAPPAAH